MTRLPLLRLSLAMSLTLLPLGSAVAQDDAAALPADVAAEIQAQMDALTEAGVPPGMAVWIDAPGYRFEGAGGVADLTDGASMPPDGAFRIGSITKMLTATVVMQLVEEGVLSLDDGLAAWLPDVAERLPNGDQVTVRDLLAHTSGISNVVEHEAYYADIFGAMAVDETTGNVSLACVERDPNDTLERYVYGKDAQFEPGTQWRYSNTNYTLLGMIVEAATSMPIAEAYSSRIYGPLGMDSTFLDCYEEPVIEVVRGYTGVGYNLADVTELHESVGWAAGGMVSTAPDLVAFARGLFGGELLDDPESLAAMLPEAGSPYGLGIARVGQDVGHAGGIAGFRTVLSYAPESDAVTVVLYNHDSADPEAGLPQLTSPALPLLAGGN